MEIQNECVHVRAEIEMVVMEKCKVSELTEQNITDEEKTAAASRTHTHRSRYLALRPWGTFRFTQPRRLILLSLLRPFLDMVYSALDCTADDYHALFVLCLLYAVSHSQGRPRCSQMNKDDELYHRLKVQITKRRM